MGQLLPVLIMSGITLAAIVLLLVPTRFKFGTDLVKFYWRGFWYFLAAIALTSGGIEVLRLAGFIVEPYDIAVLGGLMTAYVVFVMFAWFRLIGAAILAGMKKAAKPGSIQIKSQV